MHVRNKQNFVACAIRSDLLHVQQYQSLCLTYLMHSKSKSGFKSSLLPCLSKRFLKSISAIDTYRELSICPTTQATPRSGASCLIWRPRSSFMAPALIFGAARPDIKLRDNERGTLSRTSSVRIFCGASVEAAGSPRGFFYGQ
jgi:hypothetical protein